MGFRKDFIWGSATASYQIEGAAFEDGKGHSIWDTYSHAPGNVYMEHNGDVACDHAHRYREDFKLMAELGLRNYRFSVSWPRLMPEGRGEVNPKGVDLYDRMIDAMLENGIRPFMTLFHWDYPSALEARGAWQNPDSVKWFADYTELIARRYGDRVRDFITFNEPQCFLGMGYCMGAQAPGYRRSPAEAVPMSHHVLMAHGESARILHELVPGCRVGYAPCGDAAIPETESEADIEAARRFYFMVPGYDRWAWNVSWWSDPVVLGRYPEQGLSHLEQFLPKGWEKDMENIRQPLDFYAQNIYNGRVVRAAENEQGFELAPQKVGCPRTAIGWSIMPEALYWGPKLLYERYRTPFMITENGMSCHDFVSLDGAVHDPNRQDYLNRYLRAYRRAAEDGVDAIGYFVWSFLDNFEWSHGYSERFGLVYVDYETQKRTVKDSAYWYRRVIETNGENL